MDNTEENEIEEMKKDIEEGMEKTDNNPMKDMSFEEKLEYIGIDSKMPLKYKKMINILNILNLQYSEIDEKDHNRINFHFINLCGNNHKNMDLLHLVAEYTFLRNHSDYSSNWFYYKNNIFKNMRYKCTYCKLGDELKNCFYKVYAGIEYLYNEKYATMSELNYFLDGDKIETFEGLANPENNYLLDVDEVDFISVTACKVFVEGNLIEILGEENGWLRYKYWDYKKNKNTFYFDTFEDTASYIEDGFDIYNLKESFKENDDIIFEQKPERLAAYLMYKAQRDNMRYTLLFDGNEKIPFEIKQTYLFRKKLKEIKNSKYNEKTKQILINYLNFAKNYNKEYPYRENSLNVLITSNSKAEIENIIEIFMSIGNIYDYYQTSDYYLKSLTEFSYDSERLRNAFRGYYTDCYQYNAIAITDFEDLLKEKSDYRDIFLGVLSDQIRKCPKNCAVFVSGNKYAVDQLIGTKHYLKNLFNIKIDLDDMTPEEINEKLIEELNKTGEITEEFENKLLEYVQTTYSESEFKNIDYIEYLSEKIKFNHLAKVKVSKEMQLDEIPEFKRKKNLDDILLNLNELIGLQDIKEEIYNLTYLLKFYQKIQGKTDIRPNLHMILKGSPGTGKTTVARIIGDILYHLGYIKKDKIVEVEAKDLIGEYIGQTAPKTHSVIREALDGVLFIDEAYALTGQKGTSANFTADCMATLVKAMEDYRDRLVVIFAGYGKEMEDFIKENPGLLSRVGYNLDFKDYTTEELFDIYKYTANKKGFRLTKEAEDKVKEIIEEVKKYVNFGNARFSINFFEKTILQHARNLKDKIEELTEEELMEITLEDINRDVAIKLAKTNTIEDKRIGF